MKEVQSCCALDIMCCAKKQLNNLKEFFFPGFWCCFVNNFYI